MLKKSFLVGGVMFCLNRIVGTKLMKIKDILGWPLLIWVVCIGIPFGFMTVAVYTQSVLFALLYLAVVLYPFYRVLRAHEKRRIAEYGDSKKFVSAEERARIIEELNKAKQKKKEEQE
jgi:hypothetical protein